MPQLYLDYSANLDAQIAPDELLRHLNEALAESGQFEEADIKSRASAQTHVQIGVPSAGTPTRAFAHARLAILSGRTPTIKRELSQRVLAVLKAYVQPPAGWQLQLSCEVVDMDREVYAKAVLPE